jgi:tetrahydromethanopterin S-methyltransferase subunit F
MLRPVITSETSETNCNTNHSRQAPLDKKQTSMIINTLTNTSLLIVLYLLSIGVGVLLGSNCVSKCSSCDEQNICLECMQGYKPVYQYNNNNNTILDCISDVNYCKIQNPACIECLSENTTICETCNVYYTQTDSNVCTLTSDLCKATVSNCKTCLESSTCGECIEGYSLEQSQCILTCNGILSIDIGVCSSHGVCTAPNVCACDTGYSGIDCHNTRKVITQLFPTSATVGDSLIVSGPFFPSGYSIACVFMHVNTISSDRDIVKSDGLLVSNTSVKCPVPLIQNAYGEPIYLSLLINSAYRSDGDESIFFVYEYSSGTLHESFDSVEETHSFFRQTLPSFVNDRLKLDVRKYDTKYKRSIVQIGPSLEKRGIHSYNQYRWGVSSSNVTTILYKQAQVDFAIEEKGIAGNYIEVSMYSGLSACFMSSISFDGAATFINLFINVNSYALTYSQSCNLEDSVYYTLIIRVRDPRYSLDKKWYIVSELLLDDTVVCSIDVPSPIADNVLANAMSYSNYSLVLSQSITGINVTNTENKESTMVVNIDRVSIQCQLELCSSIVKRGGKASMSLESKLAIGLSIGFTVAIILVILIIIQIFYFEYRKSKTNNRIQIYAMDDSADPISQELEIIPTDEILNFEREYK